MRGRGLTGAVLVIFGGLLLAATNGYLSISVGDLLSLWPLLLILLGVSMLFRTRRGMPVGIIALLILGAAVIWYGEDRGWNLDRMLEYRGSTIAEQQSFRVPSKGGVETARFQLDAGAGSLTLTGGAALDSLLSAETNSSWGKYSLEPLSDSSYSESWHLRQEMRSGRDWFSFGRKESNATIKLNASPDWDIVANVGAADLNFDLTSLSVTSARIESGASSMTLRIGDWQQHSTVTVKTGASSVTVYVPKTSKVLLREESGLSSRDYDGFSKTGDKTYQSNDTENSQKVIDLTMQAGVSSLKVIRY